VPASIAFQRLDRARFVESAAAPASGCVKALISISVVASDMVPL
jgi:hypothetical protein